MGITALHLASKLGRLENCKLIITAIKQTKGKVIDPQEWLNGVTPFHWAAQCGHADICQLFINELDNITTLDFQGNTPLHYAVKGKNIDCVRVIADAMNNKFIKNFQRESPLAIPGITREIHAYLSDLN